MRSIGLIGAVFWAAIISIFSSYVAGTRTELVCGKEEIRHSEAFAIFAVLPIILWAGFRSGHGYVDTNAYIRFYAQVPTSFEGLKAFINGYNEDVGFTIFTAIIKRIFGTSYTPYLFIIAGVQCVIVSLFFRKYSTAFSFSLFLFIASAEYFSWVFNGMRQFLAVAITLLGFQDLLDKKYLKYICIVLIASTIHQSALIMIPIAFVVQGKPWNARSLILIALTVLVLMYTNQFTRILNTAMQNTQYSESVSSWDDDGANPIRVLFYSLPTFFSIIARREIEEKDHPVINICVNFSIISTALWLVAMVTSGIYMGRLPIYVGLYNYILLPYLFDLYFEGRETNGQLLKAGTVIVYLLYYYYQVHVVWQAV